MNNVLTYFEARIISSFNLQGRAHNNESQSRIVIAATPFSFFFAFDASISLMGSLLISPRVVSNKM